MGKIHFVDGLFKNVLQIITESRDCLDVANDLKAIKDTVCNGSDLDAETLDIYLRKKYPIINTMLNIADSMQARPSCENFNAISQSPYKAKLEQDRCGILCQTAIKKGLKPNLESCIDHIES